jgi:ABC-2 type transport system ATP-binding protein
MNKTIILASHLLDEVQKVCSHFAVLRKGKKIYSGSVREALQDTNTVSVAATDTPMLVQAISSCPGVVSVERTGDVLKMHIADDWSVVEINKYLVERNVPVSYLQQKSTSLEEKFLEILKENENKVSPSQSQAS